MTDWEGWTADGAYGGRTGASVLRALDQMCRDAGDVETGGVLIGRYADDLRVAEILEATMPPPDSLRGHSWFTRGVGGLHALLEKRWRAKRRTHYLGEWHFHPADVIVPSSVDFAQMATIAHADDYRCREPLLLIVGRDIGSRRSIRVFVCPRGEMPRELACPGPPRA